MSNQIDILPYGSNAVLINFEQSIDPVINDKIHALGSLFKNNLNYGVVSVIPAYCSLTIIFDSRYIAYKDLKSEIVEAISSLENATIGESLMHRIPVCYDAEFGLDLNELSNELQLTPYEIIRLHTSLEYRVYMMGFMPGFTFMGLLDKRLESRRKEIPRKIVPKNSVAIAGLQTGIYPNAGPGGWQIIGRIPFDAYDPRRTESAFFSAGMKVQFYSIERSEYELQLKNNSEKKAT